MAHPWPGWLRGCRVWLLPLRRQQPHEYRAIRARVAARWLELQSQVWKPLTLCVNQEVEKHPQLAASWGHPDNAGSLCASVLESAVRWAVGDRGLGGDAQLRNAAGRLQAIERELAESLDRACHLLREREEILKKHGLYVDEASATMDEFELLLERSAAGYPHWQAVTRDELHAFINVSRATSQPGPGLADVLRAALPTAAGASSGGAKAPVHARHPASSAALQSVPGGSPGSRATRVRQFFATLDGRHGRSVRTVSPDGGESWQRMGPLHWMKPKALAILLNAVAAGDRTNRPDGASAELYPADYVGRLLRAYVEVADAVDGQPD